jgi:hypothetical protein
LARPSGRSCGGRLGQLGSSMRVNPFLVARLLVGI